VGGSKQNILPPAEAKQSSMRRHTAMAKMSTAKTTSHGSTDDVEYDSYGPTQGRKVSKPKVGLAIIADCEKMTVLSDFIFARFVNSEHTSFCWPSWPKLKNRRIVTKKTLR
jgi:hypothetical protein